MCVVVYMLKVSVCRFVSKHVCMCPHVYFCIYICTCACMYLCLCILCVTLCMYMFLYPVEMAYQKEKCACTVGAKINFAFRFVQTNTKCWNGSFRFRLFSVRPYRFVSFYSLENERC